MPLKGISRRTETPLAAFTTRERLIHRRLAARAARRGGKSAQHLYERIEAELFAPRERQFARLAVPPLPDPHHDR